MTSEQIQYSAEDVIHLHRLRTVLERELEEVGLAQVAQLEMDLLPAVVDMEASGFAVDRGRLETLLADSERAARVAETETKALFINPTINLNSPVQLVTALAGIGIEVEDTKAETLATLDTPAIKPLVRFREAEKQAQLLRKLLAAIETDGRIHARFNPTGTATGRFSSSAPNLQNVSRGPTRSCFIARPGYRLVVADYSQIELRAAAVLAGETKMLEAFQQGEDLHLKTAELVLGRKATAQDRQLAKAVNFGLLYGQNAEGLARYAGKSYGVPLSPEEALNIRRKFFSGYEGLERWHKAAWTAAAGDAYQTRTRLGRRRLLADAGDQKWKRFTTLVNTPVQGGCADGIKLAMVKLSRQLPTEAKLISCVHDELIVETTEVTAEDVMKLVTETMVFEMQSLFPDVPIEVEARICTNWGGKGDRNPERQKRGTQ